MMEYTNSHPKQLAPIPEVSGWFVTTAYFAAIEGILRESVRHPLGPEFMALPGRETDSAVEVSLGRA
jgi:hypothetical protein